VTAANSEVPQVREAELQSASEVFHKLTQLDPDEKTQGTSGEVENRYLIAIGYWGLFHYLNMCGDTRNALIQVYECTQKYCTMGLMMFPPQFFSHDYARETDKLSENLEGVKLELYQAKNRNLRMTIAGVAVGLAILPLGNVTIIPFGIAMLNKKVRQFFNSKF